MSVQAKSMFANSHLLRDTMERLSGSAAWTDRKVVEKIVDEALTKAWQHGSNAGWNSGFEYGSGASGDF